MTRRPGAKVKSTVIIKGTLSIKQITQAEISILCTGVYLGTDT
jgi:hypothetical protein